MVIVGAVDKSARDAEVVREAEQLAQAFDDTVHFVHALTRTEFVKRGKTSAQAGKPLDLDQIRTAAAEMAEEAVTDVTIDYETAGLVGNPADAIVDYADEQGARYIVVSPRRRSPTGKVVFGSVAQSIMLNAPCPVVTYVKQAHKG